MREPVTDAELTTLVRDLRLPDNHARWDNLMVRAADALEQVIRERDKARQEAYTIGMTCPVCGQYGDGCTCGGVDALRGLLRECRAWLGREIPMCAGPEPSVLLVKIEAAIGTQEGAARGYLRPIAASEFSARSASGVAQRDERQPEKLEDAGASPAPGVSPSAPEPGRRITEHIRFKSTPTQEGAARHAAAASSGDDPSASAPAPTASDRERAERTLGDYVPGTPEDRTCGHMVKYPWCSKCVERLAAEFAAVRAGVHAVEWIARKEAYAQGQRDGFRDGIERALDKEARIEADIAADVRHTKQEIMGAHMVGASLRRALAPEPQEPPKGRNK